MTKKFKGKMMSKKFFKFTVKKLKWVESSKGNLLARIYMGDVSIQKCGEKEFLINFPWVFKYAISLEEAKEIAQDIWKQELYRCLEKVFKFINIVDG